MIDRHLDIPTKDGLMNTFITHPEEDGPHPLVVFLMDAPGKREELHDMARRLGSAGYYVMLPNLYYRRLREFDMASSTREIMFEHMDSLTNAMVCEDIQVLIDFAGQDVAARGGKMGCVGYCMSGPFAFAAAAAFPERMAASASFHGVRLLLDSDDSPHLDATQIKGELYFGCAETDEYAPHSINTSPVSVAIIESRSMRIPNTDLFSRCGKGATTRHRPNGIGNDCCRCINAVFNLRSSVESTAVV
jgi:carboxymethylenebutenolidase